MSVDIDYREMPDGQLYVAGNASLSDVKFCCKALFYKAEDSEGWTVYFNPDERYVDKWKKSNPKCTYEIGQAEVTILVSRKEDHSNG